MRIERDENGLVKELRKVREVEFVKVIVAGHRKFREEGCGCEICLGRFGKFEEQRKAGSDE